jgi:hypothetical protein
MQGMLREIRQSKPSDTTLSESGSRVDFIIRDFTVDPEVVYSLSYYKNVNNQIIRENPPGTTKVLANQIKDLCFCWDAASSSCGLTCSDLFPVRLEAAKSVGQKTLLFSLIEKVRLRNE